MIHPLHEIIGEIFTRDLFHGYKILKDPACGGGQNIPLFCSEIKSNQTEYCNVDLLILKSNKIKVIIEIEEADVKPIHICGKFLSSAMAKYYIHESEKNIPVPMDNSVLFIQILDTSGLKKNKTSKIKDYKSKKIEQWENIEKSVKNIIPGKESKINNYKLFYGDVSEFGVNGKKRAELVDCIQKFLNTDIQNTNK